ncbi:MAG: sigma-70 family RNA polymerase sigma factor [Bacteroidota bacterium]
MTLKRLIEGCQKQDRNCQKELYLRYCKLAINISLRYARDEHEAKDIVHNAFIKILTKIETFDFERGQFEGWIRTIVINEALQLFRSKKEIYSSNQNSSKLDKEIDPIILDQLNTEDIFQLIHTLPDGYRIVFILSVVEGYKHKEIAQKLGITESASRSQLARAKRMLRQLINEQNTLANAKKNVG